MKKVVAMFLIGLLLFTLVSCQESDDSSTDAAPADTSSIELTPMEKLDAFIVENGVQKDDMYILDCPVAIQKIKERDFTIAHMENLKATLTVEFKLIKDADGITLNLIDSSITDNGMKMERTVTLKPDGTYDYYNGIIMNGTDLGLTFKGEIPSETYTKEHIPVITESKLAPGAKLTDATKEALKDYIDLTLDCYSVVLAQDGIGITLADAGYSAYAAN